jgi:hypothetical protein
VETKLNPFEPENRYYRDPYFSSLVDLLESFIHRTQYTPSELREAALLAAIHYENRNIRTRRVSCGSEFKPIGGG